VLETVGDARLRAHIIWLPMLPGDVRERAVEASAESTDERLTHYWDSQRLLGTAWGESLGLEMAWDIYLVYGPGRTWRDSVPTPDYWMHQLSAARHVGQLLDSDSLVGRVEHLLQLR